MYFPSVVQFTSVIIILQEQHFTMQDGFHNKLTKCDFVHAKSGYYKTTFVCLTGRTGVFQTRQNTAANNSPFIKCLFY